MIVTHLETRQIIGCGVSYMILISDFDFVNVGNEEEIYMVKPCY